MGFQISNTPSASAPEGLEDGLVPARFDGMALTEHPDWAKDARPGFAADDGRRLTWTFTLTDEDGEVLYSKGDPIEIEQHNSTNFNTKSDKSKNALWMKSLSPKTFALIDAGERADVDDLIGSPCQLLIEVKDNGWPKVLNLLPPPRRRARAAAVTIPDDEE